MIYIGFSNGEVTNFETAGPEEDEWCVRNINLHIFDNKKTWVSPDKKLLLVLSYVVMVKVVDDEQNSYVV